MKNLVFIVIQILLCIQTIAQTAPQNFNNPIVSGFHSDPSICRVDDTYYMTHPTLEYFPALPIMRSKDLVNWKKIGHAIHRPDQINFSDGLKNSLGMFAPSIRYHDGTFYVICTCVECKGKFIVTATNPEGPWSDPIWIDGAIGIDPCLFWDDNGTCYYLGAGVVSGDKKEVIATLDYDHEDIYLKAVGNQLEVQFYFGKTLDQLIPIGNVQDLSIVSDEVAGRFNGTVIGLYATSLGNKSKNEASFEWFEYEGKEEK